MENSSQPIPPQQTPSTQTEHTEESSPTTPVPAPSVDQPAEAITMPDTWPGAFGIYNLSKRIVIFNLSTILTLVIISFIASITSSYMKSFMIVRLVMSIVSLLVYVAMIRVLLDSVNSKKVDISEAIKYALNFNRAGNLFLLSILYFFIAFFTLLLFVVPFFIVMPRLVLAPYLLFRDNLNALDAIQASWDMTKGHAGKVWGIIGVIILFALLTVVLVGIYLLIVYTAAFVILIEFLSKQKAVSDATTQANSPQAPVPSAPDSVSAVQ